ncbi:MAG TPA: hypothetical protein VFN40_01750 [Gemmatimonadales bacterium]|nr:hypothetical protein [Gemmatimonadales bacterium]
MNDAKAPLQLSLAAAGLLAAAVLVLQPYSAEWPGDGFRRPAEQYVQAALAQDSLALARLSATDSSVVWGLAMARRHPDALAAWARHSQAFTGERRGDTTQVFVYSASSPCDDVPIQFRFVHARNGQRVLGATLACLDSAAPAP